MKALIGKVLIFAGVGFTVFSAATGLSFSWVLLSGFTGTGGNEAGGELAIMLIVTAGALVLGCGVVKWGRYILRRCD